LLLLLPRGGAIVCTRNLCEVSMMREEIPSLSLLRGRGLAVGTMGMALVLVVCLGGLAHAADAPGGIKVLDAKYWSAFNWDARAFGRILKDGAWLDYPSAKARDEKRSRTWVKQAEFELYGKTANATICELDHGEGGRHAMSFYLPNLTQDETEGFMRLLHSRYGPSRSLDTSSYLDRRSDKIWLRFIAVEDQWDLGQTRVTVTRLGLVSSLLGSDDNRTTIVLYASSLGDSKVLTPLTALQCSRTIESTGADRPARRTTDMILFIDAYHSSLLDGEKSVIKDATMDEANIGFTFAHSSTLNARYRINRITGQLVGDAKDSKSSFRATITGMCQKLESAKPKF
jgi:hypothetical protein